MEHEINNLKRWWKQFKTNASLGAYDMPIAIGLVVIAVYIIVGVATMMFGGMK